MKKYMYVLMMLTVCAASAFAQLTDGMFAKWMFDEGSGTVASDSVGSLNATFSGASWQAGKYDGALKGTGNLVGSIGAIPQLEGAMEFAFACWVNPDKDTNDPWAALISQKNYTSSTEPCFFLGIESTKDADAPPAGYLDWDFRVCGRKVATNKLPDTTAKLLDKQWNLVVVNIKITGDVGSYDTQMTVWINGQKVLFDNQQASSSTYILVQPPLAGTE